MTTRRGIALFAALSTMAVIALLVGGMVAASTLAQRSSALTHLDAELGAAADYALVSANDSALATQPLGIAESWATTVGRVASITSATRLPHDVVWLTAESRLPGLGGRRRVNLVARWQVPALPAAPIVSRGDVRLGSRVAFAVDTSGDADCRASPADPSVLIAPTAHVSAAIVATTRADSLAADSATFLIKASQRVFLDTISRVIHVRGDTAIDAGRVDGILLVDGQVVITGAVAIHGLVIARGPIDARAGQIDLEGALLSFAAPPAGHFAVDVGEGLIRHSPCAIARAWRQILPLRPVNARSWAELF